MKKYFILLSACLAILQVVAQDISVLVKNVKTKIGKVNDYEVSGKMKTNVAFLKVPVANIKIYFKRPNRLKIKSEKGITFIPKGAVSINMNNILRDNKYTVIDAGSDKIGGYPVRIAKLLPENDTSDVVLSTLYIDPIHNLIRRAKTTTRDNGTYELELVYGKYAGYALPDKIVFSFNTKDYKLPKGVTFDFDDGSGSKQKDIPANRKGKAEITFKEYSINKGLADVIFK